MAESLSFSTTLDEIDKIRLVVFLESDIRRLLYDSKSILKPSEQTSLCSTERSRKPLTKSSSFFTSRKKSNKADLNSTHSFKTTSSRSFTEKYTKDSTDGIRQKYENWKPQPDTKQICEMIFGSMSMVYHGCTLKIHPNMTGGTHGHGGVGGAQNPCSYTMISYLSQFDPFILKQRASLGGNPVITRTAPSGSMRIDDDVIMISKSFDTIDASESEMISLPCSLSNLYIRGDPWVNMASTTGGGTSSPSLLASSSNNLNSQSETTSVSQSVISSSVSSVSKQLWQCSVPAFYAAFHDVSDLSMLNSAIGAKKSRAKLGVALMVPCFNGNGSNLIQSHIALIEGFINNFKTSVEEALIEKDRFYDLVNEATVKIKHRIYHLINMPKNIPSLPSVWLGIMLARTQKESIRAFTESLSRLSSREVRFLSYVVSNLLTRHLSWINTVEELADFQLHSIHSKTNVNKKWTQLCDLFGIVSSPPKCNRIVVHGKNQITVRRFLTLLTYFVRTDVLQKRYSRLPSIDRMNLPSNTTTSACPLKPNEDQEWGFCDVTVHKNNNHDCLSRSTTDNDDSFVGVALLEVEKEVSKTVTTEGGDAGSVDKVKTTIQPASPPRASRSPNDRLHLLTSLNSGAGESESSVSTVIPKSHNGSSNTTPSSGGSKPTNSVKYEQSLSMNIPKSPSASRYTKTLPEIMTSKSIVEEWMQSSMETSVIKAPNLKPELSNLVLEADVVEEPNVISPPVNKKISNAVSIGDSDVSTLAMTSTEDIIVELNSANRASADDASMSLSIEKGGPLHDSGFTDTTAVSKKSPQKLLNRSRNDDVIDDVIASVAEMQGRPAQNPLNCDTSTSTSVISSSSSTESIDDDLFNNDKFSTRSKYKKVDFIQGETLCAPTLVPSISNMSSTPHSLIGSVSNNYSKDAMLQGLVSDPKNCLYQIFDDSKNNFIVESKPCILCVDVDKHNLHLIEDSKQKLLSLTTSKTIQDAIMNCVNFLNAGIKPHFCLNVIDRALHSLVSKSVALSSKLLDYPNPRLILEPIGIDASDLNILVAVATSIRTVNAQD